MKFSGIQKTSLVDFPDRVATVLFAPRCNLRCPYCQNWRIVIDPKPPFLSGDMVVQILKERKRYVDAVVVTGGEPTVQADLPKFLKKLKESGFAVKLDTNGFLPNIITKSLPHVDYIALDVKTSLEKYRRLGAKNTTRFLRTVDILKNGKVRYEFRATIVPGIVEKEDIHKMGEIASGGRLFAFQQFIPGDTLDSRFNDVKPYDHEVLSDFSDVMRQYVDEVVIHA